MDKLCAICQTSISSDEAVKTCEKCKSQFHVECWDENGGCATYGCELSPKTMKGDSEQYLEGTYWGAETKICPMCGETIKVSELKCPYCKEQFDSIEPVTSKEIKDRFVRRPHQVKGNKGAIIVFICGLLGITSPFNLFFGGIWYKANKEKLQKTRPLHNLLAIVGLSISVFYSVLILFAILS